jgi:hypothetical protein
MCVCKMLFIAVVSSHKSWLVIKNQFFFFIYFKIAIIEHKFIPFYFSPQFLSDTHVYKNITPHNVEP